MLLHGLSLRRKTTTAQQDLHRLIDKLLSYIFQVQRLSQWYDVMVTVCLSARADGTKLKPFIVFRAAKRETKKLNEDFRHKCDVTTSSNAWMNGDLTLNWVKSVLGEFSFNRRSLAWDSYECHMMQSVEEALHQINVDQVIVPGGCTKYVQAPDVSWNKPFKALVSEQYDEWMASGVQEFTKAGNMWPPPRKTIVELVLTALARLPTEVITNSFTGYLAELRPIKLLFIFQVPLGLSFWSCNSFR